MSLVLNGSGIVSSNIVDGTIVNADLENTTHRVLQVVNMTNNTVTSSSSNTWIDTSVTLSITPSTTSSKILVISNIIGVQRTGNSYLGLQLLRDSTTLRGIETQMAYTGGSTYENSVGGTGITFLDSPSTTSAITYKIQMRSQGNTAQVKINYTGNSSITLMEIGV